MSHARLFRRAEIIVGKQIRRAVQAADGDAARAIRALVEWGNAGGRKRRVTVIRATRHLVGCPPTIAILIYQVVGELGEDVAEDIVVASVSELTDPRENPERCLAVELEVAAAAARAIHGWIAAECRAWREKHAP